MAFIYFWKWVYTTSNDIAISIASNLVPVFTWSFIVMGFIFVISISITLSIGVFDFFHKEDIGIKKNNLELDE